MQDLIDALQILLQYWDPEDIHPTGCQDDTLFIYVDPNAVTEHDIRQLEQLGFDADYSIESFSSYKFGSA